MMPWKIKSVSTFPALDRRLESDSASQRSAWILVAFWGNLVCGMGGFIMSVRIRRFWEAVSWSFRRCVARSWPMKPEAPVMRMVGIVVE